MYCGMYVVAMRAFAAMSSEKGAKWKTFALPAFGELGGDADGAGDASPSGTSGDAGAAGVAGPPSSSLETPAPPIFCRRCQSVKVLMCSKKPRFGVSPARGGDAVGGGGDADGGGGGDASPVAPDAGAAGPSLSWKASSPLVPNFFRRCQSLKVLMRWKSPRGCSCAVDAACFTADATCSRGLTERAMDLRWMPWNMLLAML